MNGQEQKQALIGMLVQYSETLEQEIKKLQADHEAVKRSVQILSGSDLHTRFQGRTNLRALFDTSDSKWRRFNTQEATFTLLQEMPDNWFKASEIAKRLKTLGARGSERRAFGSVVAVAVRRLVRLGKVEQDENEDGVAIFRVKKQRS